MLAVGLPALAVSTSHWAQQNQADFKGGTLKNVVATNLGELKLSRAVKTLLDEDPRISMVTSMCQAKDGSIFVGTGPQGVIMQVKGDGVTTLTTIADAVSITALVAESDGSLLIGASGAKGRVLRLDKPGNQPKELFSSENVQYIWGLAQTPDGEIYAATGPNGQLFAIHPDGKSEEIYKCDENNLTSLVSDAKDNLYVGTDPNALVIRINRKTKEAFVLYDAAEDEIAALALDEKGNLYAATGEAPSEPQPPQPPQPPKEQPGGHPLSQPQTPLPSQPPKAPTPPPQPGPAPGQPPAIPNHTDTRQSSTGKFRVESPRMAIRGLLREPLNPVPQVDPSGVVLLDVVAGADEDAPPGIPGMPGLPGGSGTPPADEASAHPDANAKNANPGEGEPKQPHGNAVYKIDADGFVTEIFREQVVIYSMLAEHGVLLVGTGSDGEIYQINPDAQETVVLAKTDAKEVTSLLAAADGRIMLGLSNTGGLAAMSDGYADSGTFVSPVMDATQVSRFGVIQLHGALPKGTSLTLATRSGNVKDSATQGWGKWSDEASAVQFMKIPSPPARYLQYRISFKTTDPAQTPVIKDVDVSYQMPHLAPVIKSIKIGQESAAGASPPAGANAGKPADAKSTGTGTQTITWDASSPNSDTLVYSLYFRTTSNGEWILMKDKLTDETYSWDTKTVADGRYEVKVVASDGAANPVVDGKTSSRVSDAVVVDNTPPQIGDLKTVMTGRTAKLTLRVTDQTSTVASMEYAVDSGDVWQTVLPDDKIFDQPEESVSISIEGLSPGAHQITLRATDSRGNVAYQTVMVTVPAG